MRRGVHKRWFDLVAELLEKLAFIGAFHAGERLMDSAQEQAINSNQTNVT
jgi:hypothetical protein